MVCGEQVRCHLAVDFSAAIRQDIEWHGSERLIVFLCLFKCADVKLLHSVKLFKQITPASGYLRELVRSSGAASITYPAALHNYLALSHFNSCYYNTHIHFCLSLLIDMIHPYQPNHLEEVMRWNAGSFTHEVL